MHRRFCALTKSTTSLTATLSAQRPWMQLTPLIALSLIVSHRLYIIPCYSESQKPNPLTAWFPTVLFEQKGTAPTWPLLEYVMSRIMSGLVSAWTSTCSTNDTAMSPSTSPRVARTPISKIVSSHSSPISVLKNAFSNLQLHITNTICHSLLQTVSNPLCPVLLRSTLLASTKWRSSVLAMINALRVPLLVTQKHYIIFLFWPLIMDKLNMSHFLLSFQSTIFTAADVLCNDYGYPKCSEFMECTKNSKTMYLSIMLVNICAGFSDWDERWNASPEGHLQTTEEWGQVLRFLLHSRLLPLLCRQMELVTFRSFIY